MIQCLMKCRKFIRKCTTKALVKINSLNLPIFSFQINQNPKINSMKKIFLILFTAGIFLNAQDKLIVEYESFTKMDMDNITTLRIVI